MSGWRLVVMEWIRPEMWLWDELAFFTANFDGKFVQPGTAAHFMSAGDVACDSKTLTVPMFGTSSVKNV